jgi:imidazolonepropionase-like amidohydrolase
MKHVTLLLAGLLGLVTSVVAFAKPPAGAPGGPGLAIRSAKVLTAAKDGPQVMDHAVVLVHDGLIEGLEPARGFELPEGYVLEDVGSRWLMPGLVELHNHIGGPRVIYDDVNDSVFLANPGLRVSASVVPDNRLLQRGVAGGVTTALYIPGSGSNISGQGVLLKIGHERYEEMELRNPGSLKLAQAGNPEYWLIRPGRSFMNWHTRHVLKQGLAYAVRMAKAHAGEGPPVPVDLRFSAFEDLLAKRTQVSAHTQAFQVVLMTITMVRQELGLDVYIDHGSFDGHRTAALAQAAGVAAILGPRAISRHYSAGIDTDGKILGLAAEYQREGHKAIGFNTDCCDDGNLDLSPPQEELSLQAAMALRYGMTNFDLESIRGLTIVPTTAAGLDHRLGSIEVGKDADILVISGDIADPRTSIVRVYTEGKVVYDPQIDGRRW